MAEQTLTEFLQSQGVENVETEAIILNASGAEKKPHGWIFRNADGDWGSYASLGSPSIKAGMSVGKALGMMSADQLNAVRTAKKGIS